MTIIQTNAFAIRAKLAELSKPVIKRAVAEGWPDRPEATLNVFLREPIDTTEIQHLQTLLRILESSPEFSETSN
jgi:hypothetical protein